MRLFLTVVALVSVGCACEPAPRAENGARERAGASFRPAPRRPLPLVREVASEGQGYDPTPANPGRYRVVFEPGIAKGPKVVEDPPVTSLSGPAQPFPEPPPVEPPAPPPEPPKIIEVPAPK